MSDAPEPQPPKEPERRRGKVARLPKSIRDQINVMIQDGVPYLQIIERTGPPAAHLNEDNLSNWKAGGYKDWLRELQVTQALQVKAELAKEIVTHSADDNAAGQAVLQIIAGNLLEFLSETDPAELRQSLLSDSDKFTRFVNSMVRLAEGGIKCELHKCRQKARSLAAQGSTGKPGISDEALLEAEAKLKLL